MNDLEITRWCAQAMGYLGDALSSNDWPYQLDRNKYTNLYEPLKNSEQLVDLIKQCKLSILWTVDEKWLVTFAKWEYLPCSVESKDLHRAVCECAAKLESIKTTI